MRKIVLSLLGVIFISGFIQDLFMSDRSFSNYLFFFIGIGIIIIYLLNKVVSRSLLTYFQIGIISINFLSILGLYLYGFATSTDSFGLGLLVIMLFTLLFAQIVIFIVHIGLNRIKEYDNIEQIENKIIVGYTLIFFIFNQVSIPNNYYIPLTTWIISYGLVFLVFGGLSLLITKGLKKDIIIPLIISLIGLIIIQNSGLDVNIFLRKPFQIIVMILLVIKFIPFQSTPYSLKT